MRYLLIAAALAATAATSATALTVETSPFITTVTAFNGFEGLGEITGGDGVTSYTEDGITVNYVGSGFIWSLSQPTPDGLYSWYPDGGGTGYTSITFAATDQIQFLANSGFFDGGASLLYEVYLEGVLLGTGDAGPLPAFGSAWVYYGFSGELFDEVRIQGPIGAPGFSIDNFEALAIDAISLGTAEAVIPEPATWGLMIAGFGLVGAAARRRRVPLAA